MRLLRVLTLAAGAAALLPHTGAAQDGRQFTDSWFWGAKAGATSFQSATTTTGGAPLVGAEWLITRTNGGLYVSYDQAFLTTMGGFTDHDPDSTTAFTRGVRLSGLRRFTMSVMVFPVQTPRWHGYAGLGLQYSSIGSATVTSPASTETLARIDDDSVAARKSAFTPVLTLGAQARLTRFSVFAQGSAAPMQQTFFLSNPGGTSMNFSLEFGIRYNVGSSIDRQRP